MCSKHTYTNIYVSSHIYPTCDYMYLCTFICRTNVNLMYPPHTGEIKFILNASTATKQKGNLTLAASGKSRSEEVASV